MFSNANFPLLNNSGKKLVTISVALLVSGSFAVGMKYQEMFNTPEPCISNLHSSTMPWFGHVEQEALENTTPYSDDSVMSTEYENPREFILAIIYQEHNDPDFALSSGRTQVINGTSSITYDKEYIVPGGCYATNLDSWDGPTLWRK